MSTTMNSLSTEHGSGKATSPMRSTWGRLLWKDAREIAPVWITLSLAAVLCLLVTSWMVNRELAHIAPLYISGHTFIALCSVITGVFLLANEDENRTLHLLRNLPLAPRQILWQKLLLGSLGVVLIACFIAAFTMLAANFVECRSLETNSSFRFTAGNVVLLPLLYLTISFLSAMRSRSLFYGMLIAGFISVGVIWILEPTWLGAKNAAALRERSGIRWLWVTLAIAGGVSALVFKAGHWVEEKVGKQKSTRGKLLPSNLLRPFALANNAQSNVSLASTFSVLLWQSCRQIRKPLLSCLALVVIGWLLIPVGLASEIFNSKPNKHEFPIVISFMSLVWMLAMMIAFASTIFLDDKRNDNFRFFQQNRERARWFWLSRLLPFWALAFSLVLAWKFLLFDPAINEAASSGFWGSIGHGIARPNKLVTSIGIQVASQSLLVPLLSMFAIIGIGQYFSMFVRNPILSFVFTGILSPVFLAITTYVVYVNESVWWTLVPIVISIYLATWWRSKSWLATSHKALNFFLPLAVPAIVLAVTIPSFIHHRATEYDDLVISPSEHGTWSRSSAYRGINHGTESQADEAADLYREAISLWSKSYSGGEMPWPKKQTKAYVDKNKDAIAKILAAAEVPICAPFLDTERNTRGDQISLLRETSLANAHYQVLMGNLPAAKLAIDAHDRVWQRTNDGLAYNRHYSGYYSLLARWADHPDQTADAIKSAIAQLEGLAIGTHVDNQPVSDVTQSGQDEPQAISPLAMYREFGGEQFFMDLQYEIAAIKGDGHNHYTSFINDAFWLMPWESQRWRKMAQRRAIHLYQLQQYSLGLIPADNHQLFRKDQLADSLNSMGPWPHIPLEEDRLDISNFYHSWGIAQHRIEELNWRRYMLLRLGLAAYKIEHDEYPEDLVALDSYYQRGLPVLSTGQMFGWYKNGLEHDLIHATYKDVESSTVGDAFKIAEGQSPLLLPFAIDPLESLPKPVNYEKGKLGIDFDKIRDRRVHYRHGITSYSQYRLELNVGTKED